DVDDIGTESSGHSPNEPGRARRPRGLGGQPDPCSEPGLVPDLAVVDEEPLDTMPAGLEQRGLCVEDRVLATEPPVAIVDGQDRCRAWRCRVQRAPLP